MDPRPLVAHAKRALFIGCLLASASSAAQPAPDAGQLAQMPIEQLLGLEVQSASRYAQRLSDAPSLVSIVTAADIAAYGYRTLADVLRSMRGVTVTYDRNYTYLGVRGFARPGDYNGRILLLVDGHRVNDNVYEQATIGSDFVLPVDLIERVEFVPGPGSSVYGANAFSGVINVITKGGGSLAGARASGSLGSLGAREALVSYGRAAGSDPGVLVAFNAFHVAGADLHFPEFDSPPASDGVAHGLDYDRGYRAFAKLEWSNTTVSLAASSRTKGIPTASFDQTFNDPASRTIDDWLHLALDHRQAIAPGIDVNANLAYGEYRYHGDYPYSTDPIIINRDELDGRWLDVEASAVVTRFAQHKIGVGVDVRHHLRRTQKNFDVDPYVLFLDDRRTGTTSGVYVQDEIAFTPQWLLNAGVRYDDHISGTSTSPRLALIWHASEQTTAKLLYGTAFRDPNAYELYYTIANWKRNPDLRPERVQSIEAIVEHYFVNDARVGLSLFHNRIRGVIELVTDPTDDYLVFVNRSGATARGVELDWEQRWTSGARAHASYSLQNITDNATGATLTNAARQLAKLNLTGPLAGTLDGAIEAQYVDRRPTIAGRYAASYAVVNATLTAHVMSSLDVSLSVYNLFDRRYADPGSVEHVQDLLVQDGRTFRLKASYAF